jgi:hypothetical protein
MGPNTPMFLLPKQVACFVEMEACLNQQSTVVLRSIERKFYSRCFYLNRQVNQLSFLFFFFRTIRVGFPPSSMRTWVSFPGDCESEMPSAGVLRAYLITEKVGFQVVKDLDTKITLDCSKLERWNKVGRRSRRRMLLAFRGSLLGR